MKLLRKILFIGIILFVLIFISLHVFVNIKGKSLVAKKLENTFNRKVTIGSLNTSFPANIHIKNIEAKGLFRLEEVIAGGGLFDIFRKRFKLSLLKVVNPEITIERNFINSTAKVLVPFDVNLQDKTNKQEGVDKKSTSPNLNPLALLQNRFLSQGFSIGRLIITNGIFNFTDKVADNQVITIKIAEMNIKVDNLNSSGGGNQITNFQLRGLIPWRETEEAGKIEAEGWLNFLKKNMEATLRITDIDGIYLYPYYSKWVDLEKARIERANLNFTSNIHGLNNEVAAYCHLELTDIIRKQRSPDEPQEKAEKIADVVLGIFKALNQGKIVLDFTIRTKMDRPEFGFGNIKMAFEDKLAQARSKNGVKTEDILALPAKLLEGTVKGATDLSKAVIEGTFAVGNELKKAIEGAFKKEPKEKKE